MVGVVLSLPIMRLQDLKWREEDGERFPAMTAVRDGVKEANGPLMDGMTPIQVVLEGWE